MDVMAKLVKNVINTRFNNLTVGSVGSAKKALIDNIGAMLAGSSIEGCRLLVEAIREMGGAGDSTISVFGEKVPVNMATLANAAMTRAADIDDVNDAFPLHPGVIIVPTALTISERLRGVSGRDLITAVALGQDLMVRMAYATSVNPIASGRYNLFKVFAACATAGKLLRLDEEGLLNAMGIAYAQLAGGDTQALSEGVMTSYVQEGLAGKAAVEAALFARKGITGTKNVLEGPRGFFGAFEPNPKLDALTSELGSAFRGGDISIKPYASCRSSHGAVDLALSIVKDLKVHPADIERVTVRVNEITYKLTCDPIDKKLRPMTQSEAQFSLPFIVATALIRGDFFIEELSEGVLNNKEILSLAARVKPVLDQGCETGCALGNTVMEIKTCDGRKFSATKLFPKGNPKDPMSAEECLDKLRKCVKYSYRPFPDSQIDRITDMLSNLEHLDDLRQLVRLLVPD
jgi:2-methylcitrate dehydratase PrpD